MRSIDVLNIVGARPQFVKLAAVERQFGNAAARHGVMVSTKTLHTGQHYDDNMSRVFFEDLAIEPPAVNLDIGSGYQGEQTGKMLAAVELSLLQIAPDVVVVYGDTNSTLAGALAASKLHIPIAHVEAGLRSFNRRMPEEINRILTDNVSDVLLAPTAAAVMNLQREGLAARTKLTGDVMYDAVLHHVELARSRSKALQQLDLRSGSFALATIHRAENTEPTKLGRLLDRLNAVAATHCKVVFPVHPRTRAVIVSHLPDWVAHDRLQLVEPLGYLDLLRVLNAAAFVMTDSGGLQKEAAFLGRPCFTLREETEWTETVELGLNLLVGGDGERLESALVAHFANPRGAVDQVSIDAAYGSGNAGAAVCDAVVQLVLSR